MIQTDASHMCFLTPSIKMRKCAGSTTIFLLILMDEPIMTLDGHYEIEHIMPSIHIFSAKIKHYMFRIPIMWHPEMRKAKYIYRHPVV